jgi:hypothetical protein
MSAGHEIERMRPYDRFKDEAKRFFESQLESIGLSEVKIKAQDIPSLEDSLVRVDEALIIRYPDSFGVLRISMTSGAQKLDNC